MYRKLQKIEGYTRKQIVSYMRLRLRYDWNWTSQALLRLYEFQTLSEKTSGVSVEQNGMGFSGFDAPFLSHVVCRLRCHANFAPEMKDKIQRKVRRYAEQVVEISDMDKLKVALDRYYNVDENIEEE